MSRRGMQRGLRMGEMVKIWPGIYSLGTPSTASRLRGLDLKCGQHVAVCLGTAAAIFGFDTEDSADLHILNPAGHLLRAGSGLVVHRRDGVPLTSFRGRRLTTAPWTAIEVARSLRRPRALATLDATLHSGACDRQDLVSVSKAQAGRRGIVMVRELIPLARSEADSAMESEARLVMLDGGLEEPALQHQIIDRDGRVWRVDFAWPDRLVAVEYDGFEWHSSSEALRRDRQKRAALEELGWRVISIVSDDVRRQPSAMVRRIDAHLNRVAAA